jgi:hypothetical protein
VLHFCSVLTFTHDVVEVFCVVTPCIVSSYVLSSTMLPLLEIFLQLLLWNSFQCNRHIFFMSSTSCNLRPYKADFSFGNSQKSLGAKSWKQGG